MSSGVERIILTDADITTLAVDAVVNAANSALSGGGGVDGAIHRAAGPELQEACRLLGRCPTGSAVLTPGFGLPAPHIIHAVGPVWRGGDRGEAEQLRSCYRSALQIAASEGFQTVAFPAISCGAYRYPIRSAAEIAVRTASSFLSESRLPVTVRMCCVERQVLAAYEAVLGELAEEQGAGAV